MNVPYTETAGCFSEYSVVCNLKRYNRTISCILRSECNNSSNSITIMKLGLESNFTVHSTSFNVSSQVVIFILDLRINYFINI